MSVTKEALVTRLRGSGLDVVRVAPPRVPEQAAACLRERVGSGAYDAMPWLARTLDDRLDPARFLPGVRSVVVVAAAYGPPKGETPRGADDARIARYARGWDYHTYLRERLEDAAAWLAREAPDARCRVAVDAEPVLEKALAVAAGVGWLGKNGLVIHPEHGSRIVLGELFTTLSFLPDEPLPEACGACEACLRACPSVALVAPSTIDPARCVSFRTVEARDAEDPDGADLDGWVFGCDACQDACPANRSARPGSASVFASRAARLERERYLSMSEDEFRRVFAGTAVLRGARRGLRGRA